jgi:hypothetical protein
MLSGLAYVVLDLHHLRQCMDRLRRQAAQSATPGDSVDNFLHKVRELCEVARLNASLVGLLNNVANGVNHQPAPANAAPAPQH